MEKSSVLQIPLPLGVVLGLMLLLPINAVTVLISGFLGLTGVSLLVLLELL